MASVFMWIGPNPVSKENAQILADRIRAYWHRIGHTQVMAYAKQTSVLGHGEVWVVRSNLIRGLPPPAMKETFK